MSDPQTPRGPPNATRAQGGVGGHFRHAEDRGDGGGERERGRAHRQEQLEPHDPVALVLQLELLEGAVGGHRLAKRGDAVLQLLRAEDNDESKDKEEL